MSSGRLRLFVVEDDPRMLKTIIRVLTSFGEFEVVGEALSGEESLPAIFAAVPDLVLLDLELPQMDGIAVTDAIRAKNNNIEVLILTSFEDEKKVYQAIQAGASGYLTKKSAMNRLRSTIADVMAGGTVIEPRLARRFWNYFQSVQSKGALDEKDLLKPLECDVLQMVARGLTNQETGDVLQIDRRTVRTHLSNIYQKLGTNSRTQAVTIALRKGLISL